MTLTWTSSIPPPVALIVRGSGPVKARASSGVAFVLLGNTLAISFPATAFLAARFSADRFSQ